MVKRDWLSAAAVWGAVVLPLATRGGTTQAVTVTYHDGAVAHGCDTRTDQDGLDQQLQTLTDAAAAAQESAQGLYQYVELQLDALKLEIASRKAPTVEPSQELNQGIAQHDNGTDDPPQLDQMTPNVGTTTELEEEIARLELVIERLLERVGDSTQDLYQEVEQISLQLDALKRGIAAVEQGITGPEPEPDIEKLLKRAGDFAQQRRKTPTVEPSQELNQEIAEHAFCQDKPLPAPPVPKRSSSLWSQAAESVAAETRLNELPDRGNGPNRKQKTRRQRRHAAHRSRRQSICGRRGNRSPTWACKRHSNRRPALGKHATAASSAKAKKRSLLRRRRGGR